MTLMEEIAAQSLPPHVGYEWTAMSYQEKLLGNQMFLVLAMFAFIFGVLPLVLASEAGANARASIGITVFTGMLASTCLAISVVPLFFVLQRFEEWLTARKARQTIRGAAE